MLPVFSTATPTRCTPPRRVTPSRRVTSTQWAGRPPGTEMPAWVESGVAGIAVQSLPPSRRQIVDSSPGVSGVIVNAP